MGRYGRGKHSAWVAIFLSGSVIAGLVAVLAIFVIGSLHGAPGPVEAQDAFSPVDANNKQAQVRVGPYTYNPQAPSPPAVTQVSGAKGTTGEGNAHFRKIGRNAWEISRSDALPVTQRNNWDLGDHNWVAASLEAPGASEDFRSNPAPNLGSPDADQSGTLNGILSPVEAQDAFSPVDANNNQASQARAGPYTYETQAPSPPAVTLLSGAKGTTGEGNPHPRNIGRNAREVPEINLLSVTDRISSDLGEDNRVAASLVGPGAGERSRRDPARISGSPDADQHPGNGALGPIPLPPATPTQAELIGSGVTETPAGSQTTQVTQVDPGANGALDIPAEPKQEPAGVAIAEPTLEGTGATGTDGGS